MPEDAQPPAEGTSTSEAKRVQIDGGGGGGSRADSPGIERSFKSSESGSFPRRRAGGGGSFRAGSGKTIEGGNSREGSRPPSRTGPQYVSEVTYAHAVLDAPDDDAHLVAKRIGETPPAPLGRQLTRRNSLGASMRRNLEPTETEEQKEQVRRKSVFVAQQAVFKIETDAKGNEKEIGDMKPALRASALEIASEAIVRGGWDNEISAVIKKKMEQKHQSITGGKWHCIVGPDFGSFVTHEKGFFTYFYLPRNLSPIEALEKARAERHARAARMEQRMGLGGGGAPAVTDSGPGGGLSTEDVIEKGLENEVVKRVSQAGFSVEAASISEEHPMLDTRRSGVTFGKGEEEKRMVGILLWRT